MVVGDTVNGLATADRHTISKLPLIVHVVDRPTVIYVIVELSCGQEVRIAICWWIFTTNPIHPLLNPVSQSVSKSDSQPAMQQQVHWGLVSIMYCVFRYNWPLRESTDWLTDSEPSRWSFYLFEVYLKRFHRAIWPGHYCDWHKGWVWGMCVPSELYRCHRQTRRGWAWERGL